MGTGEVVLGTLKGRFTTYNSHIFRLMVTEKIIYMTKGKYMHIKGCYFVPAGPKYFQIHF